MDILLYDEQIINIINEFLKKYHHNIEFNELHLKIVRHLMNNKNLIDNLILGKDIKRKIHNFLLYSKRKKVIQFKKNLSLIDNKFCQLIIFIFLFLIYNIQNELEEEYENEYEINLKKIFLMIIHFYKNNLLDFDSIILFFNINFELIIDSQILSDINIKNLVLLIDFWKKIIKISNINKNNNSASLKEENKKELMNKSILKVFEKIFGMNNKKTIDNIKFCHKIVKHPKILELLKLCYEYYDNNIIDLKNKEFIKKNLVKLLSNNFNNNHLNYLYYISKKCLLNYTNNKIETQNKNYFSLINGIIEFLLELKKAEDNSIKNHIFYFNKYFIFDSSNENSGIRTSSFDINTSNKLGLSLIFSFYAISRDENFHINNKVQTILSINDEDRKSNIFKICLKNANLYLYTSLTSKKEILLTKDVNYNHYNICFMCHVQNTIHFYFNNKRINTVNNINFKNVNKINVELGYNQFRNEIFNGVIGPVLIFNSLRDNQKVYEKIINTLKGKYYLLGEIFRGREEPINANEVNDNFKNIDNNIFFSYEEYYGVSENDLELNKFIKEAKKFLGNLVLYINPEVVLNHLNFKDKNRLRDYQIYNNCFDEVYEINHSNIYYEFNHQESIINLICIENDLSKVFINSNGYNFLVFNIESIYNYLQISFNENTDIDIKTFVIM